MQQGPPLHDDLVALGLARLGFARFQRCPVGDHWALVRPVNDANEWVAVHRAGGEAALAARRRGRRQGEKTVLAPWQQAQVAQAIREKNPDQLRLPGFLWTRALVCELIDRRFGIRVTEKTAGRRLRQPPRVPRFSTQEA